jgi:hypothetical protein
MCLVILSLSTLIIVRYQPDKEYQGKVTLKPTSTIEVIYESKKDLIVRLAKEKGFNVNTALVIAECESQYGLFDYNLQGSSAKGIYQFTDRTWKHYCSGDVLNSYDNIYCFINLYERHPNWWACKI